MIFLAVALCIINLILWVVFLSKFKKLFTADDVIASYRQELNKLLSDIDRHTARDVAAIENVSKELKAIVAEADRHVAVAKTELERQETSKAFQQKLTSKSPRQAKQTVAQQRVAEGYQRGATPHPVALPQDAVQPGASFAITPAGKQQLGEQGTLFDESLPPTTFTVEPSGASYGAVPMLTPSVSFSDEPIQAKKDFGARVKELALRGETIEDIARILERSTTEVQFAIDMGI